MRIYVWSEARFARSPDGAVWTEGANSYRFWTRYLSAFDEVRVVARVRDVPQAPAQAHRVDRSSVAVVPLPYYVGSGQLAKNYRRLRRRGLEIIQDQSAAMLFRVPTIVASAPLASLRKQGRPYGLEVVGDPQEVFKSGASNHPLRTLLRTLMVRRLRLQCAQAAAVSYVTLRSLQEKYPARPGAVTATYTSAELGQDAYIDRHRSYAAPLAPPVNIVTVAAMEQPYKGVDTVIDALALCADEGLPTRLRVVGDGRLRGDLERRAEERTPEGTVEFLGSLPEGAPVRQVLDESDVFVLASHTEGLPRALLEAMARAVPSVATSVGGIPELLGADLLVDPGRPPDLARAILQLAQSPERLNSASRENLDTAKRYAIDVLAEARDGFYRELRRLTGQAGSG